MCIRDRVDIVHSGDGRVLSGLYSVLFCRKSICVISHRVQHVETLQAFVTGVNITGYVSPVSYTHLDVYKRQTVASIDHCLLYPFHFISHYDGIFFIGIQFQFVQQSLSLIHI